MTHGCYVCLFTTALELILCEIPEKIQSQSGYFWVLTRLIIINTIDTMINENVLRFLTIRQGNLRSRRAAIAGNKNIYLFPVKDPQSSLVAAISAKGSKASQKEIREIINNVRKKPDYLVDINKLKFDVEPLRDWMAEKESLTIKNLNLTQEIKNLYQKNPDKLVASEMFQTSYRALRDTILAEAIVPSLGREEETLDDFVVAFKLINLVSRIAAGENFPEELQLGNLITNTTIILPNGMSLARLPLSEKGAKERAEQFEKLKKQRFEKINEQKNEFTRLKIKITNLQAAHREILNLIGNPSAFSLHLEEEIKTKPKEAEKVIKTTRRAARARTLEIEGPETPTNELNLIFRPTTIEGLNKETKDLLQVLKLNPEAINPFQALRLIEEEMSHTDSQLPAESKPNQVIKVGSVSLNRKKFIASMQFHNPGIFDLIEADIEPVDLMPWEIGWFLPRCQLKIGIGDLLMLKQKIKAYELTEFAHVENVLAGESREREHRRLNVREEITTVEEERETEKERDLQSTERHELQNEAEKTVKDEMKLEAGLQISGSYGPSVSFTSSLNAGFSTSTEESQKKAVSYSREVMEKTSERVRERVREERKKRVLEEIEEVNRHKVDNSNASVGHIRGIYRWLNKIYDAQVFNYGQRMMYEFVIPEPAAYYLYALIENPPQGTVLEEPEPPTYSGQPLKPANLSRTNYHQYVSKYKVTNSPVPPTQFQTLAFFEKQDGTEAGDFGRANKIEIPKGYTATGSLVQRHYSYWSDDPAKFRVRIGGRNYKESGYKSFSYNYEGEISIAVWGMYIASFALAVDVFCELTTEGFAKWQRDIYDAIMEAYLEQKMDYEEKLRATEIQKGIEIAGRNPLENRRIEREELKKLALMILTNSTNIARNSYLPWPEPTMNLVSVCPNDSYIRFFENAFEWQNMLYVFYPYFWGRKARWVSVLHLKDPDLDFAAFLKAGATRIQVPVRPGFERAVAHFCQYGEIWEGNNAPLMDDNLYVPIVDEITENLGKLEGGVPYPEDSQPWEVNLPTSLVVVQNLEEIAGIRDTLTGNNIKLLNP